MQNRPAAASSQHTHQLLNQGSQSLVADLIITHAVSTETGFADLLATGRAALTTGDLPAAIDAFSQATALIPGHSGALGELSVALSRAGRLIEAVKFAEAAIRSAPRSASLHIQFGNLLLKRGNLDRAEKTFLKALEIDPVNTGALGALASVQVRQGRDDEAVDLLIKTVALRPQDAGLQVRLGQTFEEHHRLDEAASAYRAASQADPGNKLASAGLRRVRNPDDVFTLIDRVLADLADTASLHQLAVLLDISADRLADLAAFVRAPDPVQVESLAGTSLEAAFLQTICDIKARQDHRATYSAFAPIRTLRVVGPEIDPLGEPASHEVWQAAQWLSAHMLRKTPACRRSAVVMTMRDEGLYILEWVAHYRALGFDHIFIYSNDNVDGSEGLLRALATSGEITYLENQMDERLTYHPQKKAYAHALNSLAELWEFEWVLFADADELLIPDARYENSIAALLDDAMVRFQDRAPSAICFNWHSCVSAFRYSYEPELLLRRFPHGLGRRGMKSIVRLQDVFSMHTIHFPDYRHDGFMVRSDFQPMNKASRWRKLAPVFGSARINHYWTKSFEEFGVKFARGNAASVRDKLWQRTFDTFFTNNAAETDENLTPVAEKLILAVQAELDRLMALPGMADTQACVRAQLPRMLESFADQGGLPTIYEHVRVIMAGRTDMRPGSVAPEFSAQRATAEI